jgi:hypothetical protein
MRNLQRRIETSASASSAATERHEPGGLSGLLHQGQQLQHAMSKLSADPSEADRWAAPPAHTYPSIVHPALHKAARPMRRSPSPNPDGRSLQPQPISHAHSRTESTPPPGRAYSSQSPSAAAGGVSVGARLSGLRRAPPELEVLYAMPATAWTPSAKPSSGAPTASSLSVVTEQAELVQPQQASTDTRTAEHGGAAHEHSVLNADRSVQADVVRLSLGSVHFGLDLERKWASLRRSERMWLELGIPLQATSRGTHAPAAPLTHTLQFGVGTAVDGSALLEGSAEIPVCAHADRTAIVSCHCCCADAHASACSCSHRMR